MYKTTNTSKKLYVIFILLTTVVICVSACKKNGNNIDYSYNRADTAIINKLNSESFTLRNSNPDSSKTLALKAIERSKKINYLLGSAEGYSRMGIYEKNKGNYKSAIDYYKQSLYYRQQLDSAALIANIYNNIGNVFKDSAVYDSSVYYLTKAIIIADSISDTINQAKFRNNLGIAHDNFKNYRKSLQYYYESLLIKEEINDSLGIMQSYINIGSAYYSLKKYDSALLYLRPVLRSQKLLTDKEIGIAYNNAALNYQRIEKPDSALIGYTNAVYFYRKANSKDGLARSLSNLGIFCLSQNVVDSCYRYLNESTQLAEEENMTALLSENYRYLADYFTEKKIFNTASAYYAKALHYDSLLTVETDHQIRSYAEIQTKFETEKARQQFLAKQEKQKLIQNIIIGSAIGSIIILVLLFNRRQLNKKLQYQKQLAQDRTRISSDLHDDIGAALSSISMYSDVVKGHVDNKEFSEADTLLTEIATTSRELMDNMSDLVWAINPKNDSFERIIHRTKSFSYRILQNKNIHLHFTADDTLQNVNLSMEARHNLFMIYKESINNAAKYSQAKNVYLTIRNTGKQIISEIQDDGNGFEMKKGSDGNGLKNMKRRAEDMGAQFSMQSKPGEGTQIQVIYTIT